MGIFRKPMGLLVVLSTAMILFGCKTSQVDSDLLKKGGGAATASKKSDASNCDVTANAMLTELRNKTAEVTRAYVAMFAMARKFGYAPYACVSVFRALASGRDLAALAVIEELSKSGDPSVTAQKLGKIAEISDSFPKAVATLKSGNGDGYDARGLADGFMNGSFAETMSYLSMRMVTDPTTAQVILRNMHQGLRGLEALDTKGEFKNDPRFIVARMATEASLILTGTNKGTQPWDRATMDQAAKLFRRASDRIDKQNRSDRSAEGKRIKAAAHLSLAYTAALIEGAASARAQQGDSVNLTPFLNLVQNSAKLAGVDGDSLRLMARSVALNEIHPEIENDAQRAPFFQAMAKSTAQLSDRVGQNRAAAASLKSASEISQIRDIASGSLAGVMTNIRRSKSFDDVKTVLGRHGRLSPSKIVR